MVCEATVLIPPPPPHSATRVEAATKCGWELSKSATTSGRTTGTASEFRKSSLEDWEKTKWKRKRRNLEKLKRKRKSEKRNEMRRKWENEKTKKEEKQFEMQQCVNRESFRKRLAINYCLFCVSIYTALFDKHRPYQISPRKRMSLTCAYSLLTMIFYWFFSDHYLSSLVLSIVWWFGYSRIDISSFPFLCPIRIYPSTVDFGAFPSSNSSIPTIANILEYLSVKCPHDRQVILQNVISMLFVLFFILWLGVKIRHMFSDAQQGTVLATPGHLCQRRLRRFNVRVGYYAEVILAIGEMLCVDFALVLRWGHFSHWWDALRRLRPGATLRPFQPLVRCSALKKKKRKIEKRKK